jgi:hypothetical protein
VPGYPPPATSSVQQALSQLSPDDRARAIAQKDCPVTGQPLGSMGKPFRLVLEGKPVFLCCKGCEAALRRKAGEYLSKLKRQ